MYNRYIRSDNGSYVRIPQEEPPASASEPPKDIPPKQASPPSGHSSPHKPPPDSPRLSDSLTGMLRHILDQFHLDNVDSGDLLLLGLLFFLFREDADEELLAALGLLLIL